MWEERDDVIVLVDENGEETEFEYRDTIEMNGSEYVVLIPLDEEESEDIESEEEVVILKIERGDDGEDTFVSVEDEDELDNVFQIFTSRMEDEYDYDDEDDE